MSCRASVPQRQRCRSPVPVRSPPPVYSDEAIAALKAKVVRLEKMKTEFDQIVQTLRTKERKARAVKSYRPPPTAESTIPSTSPTKVIEDLQQEEDAQKTEPPPQPVVIPLEDDPINEKLEEQELMSIAIPPPPAPLPPPTEAHVEPIDVPPTEAIVSMIGTRRMVFTPTPDGIREYSDRILPISPTGSKRGRFDSKGRRMMRSYIARFQVAVVPHAPRPWRPPLAAMVPILVITTFYF